MKAIILAALMMSSMALSAAAAGTQEFCTAGSRILVDRTVNLNSDLTAYNGMSCESDANVKIVFDATSAPNGFGITAKYTDGTIGAGGAIQIIGPDDNKAAATCPVLIRIERNIFETDAVMVITGSFSTTSQIFINNNKFDVGVSHDLTLGINTNFISAITFGNYEKEQLMFTNAQFNIYDNTIHVEDRSGGAEQLETYGVYASSHLYMSTGAGVHVMRNNFTGSSRKKAVGVYFPRYAYSLGNNTLFQITGNNMDLTNGVMFHSPTVFVSGEYDCHADFNQNYGRLTPVSSSNGNAYAMIIGPVNLTSTSSVEIADNVIENIAEQGQGTARMFVNGPVHVREQSGLYIWYNTMNTMGGSPQMAFGGPVTVEQQAKLYFVGNQMERQEALILALSPLSFYTITLRDEGNIAISQNKFGSPNGNNKPLMIALSTAVGGGVVNYVNTSTLDVCRNTWYDAQLDASALNAAVAPNLKAVVTDPAMCPAEITTTTMAPRTTSATSSTAPRTTVAEDNAAPAMLSARTAVVVAFIGAIASLFA
jgi:hypothetical protein